jgi:deoxyhypusine synthase
MYFHTYKRPEFLVDIVEDIRAINDQALRAKCTGMIILGGGIVKHHTCNANLMRNGAEYSVYINTGQEFDGSDSGASPDEAVSLLNAHRRNFAVFLSTYFACLLCVCVFSVCRCLGGRLRRLRLP